MAGLVALAILATACGWVYALVDPATRMPPADALPFTLTAAERDSLLDLYSPLPDKRISAARHGTGKIACEDPELAAQVAPFLAGLLADGETPKNRRAKPALSVAYAKSLIYPPEVSFEVRPLLCNSWMRPDLAATRALGEMGKPAVETLLRVLHDSHKPLARQNAARALGMIDDPRARAATLAALKDPAWQVRAGAVDGLSGPYNRPRIGLSAPVLAAIVAATRDEHPLVRRWAVEGLRGDGPGVREALKAALKDPDEKVRTSAARMLSWHESVWGRAVLAAHTQDPDDDVRAAANRALRE
jgi:hypothetical protein